MKFEAPETKLALHPSKTVINPVCIIVRPYRFQIWTQLGDYKPFCESQTCLPKMHPKCNEIAGFCTSSTEIHHMWRGIWPPLHSKGAFWTVWFEIFLEMCPSKHTPNRHMSTVRSDFRGWQKKGTLMLKKNKKKQVSTTLSRPESKHFWRNSFFVNSSFLKFKV